MDEVSVGHLEPPQIIKCFKICWNYPRNFFKKGNEVGFSHMDYNLLLKGFLLLGSQETTLDNNVEEA